MPDKISSQDASSLLKTAGATIRALQNEVRNLQQENAGFKKEARARRILNQMEEKGLQSEISAEEKLAHLIKSPNLDVVEEAVKMASAQNVGFGRLAQDGEGPGGGGQHPFETFILTGEVE